MNIYLEECTTYFYDPHGTPDFGGTKYQILRTVEEYDKGVTYNDDGEAIGDDDEHYGQDGYNCEVDNFRYTKISEDDAVKYQKVINDYENLKTLFGK